MSRKNKADAEHDMVITKSQIEYNVYESSVKVAVGDEQFPIYPPDVTCLGRFSCRPRSHFDVSLETNKCSIGPAAQMDGMSTHAQNSKFVPSYRFVDGSKTKYSRSDQSHAQRESARMRQWERRKDLISSITTAGQLRWTRRSTTPVAKKTPGTKENGDPVLDGETCPTHARASRRQTDAAKRELAVKRSVYGTGSSIFKLKPHCTDPFDTSVVPIEGKCLDALLDFRKSYRSACHDRF